ncbi:signal peptidase I [Aminomonas paucivorans DSM 12260]|uniref:Signal peptidase I n=2 Tax=Aminomonas TaxID=81411 RepID=E3CVQ3_9BACT|nr:signal peptidase I [Aminomonas paucivorans DSM 12260]
MRQQAAPRPWAGCWTGGWGRDMAKPWWREALETILWALVLALVLRTFVVQAFWIPSGSMIPTLDPGDRVLVLKFWYHLPSVDPKRGNLVVFKYPVDPRRDFVKRIIGLPGETVELREGKVYVNGVQIDEPYVVNSDTYTMAATEVPKDSYFCMGDNRPNSQDSRFWGFVPRNFLKGPVVFRYWPLTRIGLPR